MAAPDFSKITRFEWGEGNDTKNWLKHKVSQFECEQVFFNEPLVVESDESHSGREARFYALGQTDKGRLLFVVFTIRKDSIRVISARDMKAQEIKEYK